VLRRVLQREEEAPDARVAFADAALAVLATALTLPPSAIARRTAVELRAGIHAQATVARAHS
jgi:hypothetical protein